MNKIFKKEKEIEITEFAEVILSDDIEMNSDIREWLQASSVQIKDYGFAEVNREEEYYAILNEISDYLSER